MSERMSNLIGNAISMAVGVQDLKQSSLSQVANVAHELISEVTNEAHFLDLIDWIEHHRPGLVLAKIQLGLGGPAMVVSSGHELLTTEIDFGFGSPVFGTSYSTITRLEENRGLTLEGPEYSGGKAAGRNWGCGSPEIGDDEARWSLKTLD
ncbi:hypothetical protein HHK36_000834 [Tetracentron sinense]|uniref:Uncharacterized protein n=1 Tax=Tetracentron sinense TaxID=13715 RepID=A0A835DUD4_TETSI|nr:hypothetical protein HHK36_000834 [Tetracentron sinense]